MVNLKKKKERNYVQICKQHNYKNSWMICQQIIKTTKTIQQSF